MRYWVITGLLALMACNSGGSDEAAVAETPTTDTLRYAEEVHLRNVQQLTFGGDNAEAYFSFDGKSLVFQRTTRDSVVPCDQIFMGAIPAAGAPFEFTMVSTGAGRTTCAYSYPDNQQVIYASTHMADSACPPEIDRAKVRKYVWPIYNTYELFVYNPVTGEHTQLTDNAFYDAEATVSPRGDKVVFTSDRSGDLELYTMNLDGSDVKQITDGLGYDGGAFFSPDGEWLVFRASRPATAETQQEYKDLLAQGMVAPSDMEVYVCRTDGSELTQVTNLGKANWAPFFHPDGKRILFASNHASETGRLFNLYMINIDGTGLKQITFDGEFDAFPMFSPDGSKLVWCSNRNNGDTRDTNIFIADWVENPDK